MVINQTPVIYGDRLEGSERLKPSNYVLESRIVKKVQSEYSNMYLLNDLKNKLNKINDNEFLQQILHMQVDEIILEFVGDAKFKKYYPDEEDMYLSDQDHRKLIYQLEKEGIIKPKNK